MPFARAGTWGAEIPSLGVDDDGDWYFEVGYNTGIAENRIGMFPLSESAGQSSDLDCIVPPDVLAQMRTGIDSGGNDGPTLVHLGRVKSERAATTEEERRAVQEAASTAVDQAGRA